MKRLNIILGIFIIVLLDLVVSPNVIATTSNLQNKYLTFLDYKDVVNKTPLGWGSGNGILQHQGWWYYNGLAYNSINNIDFSKDFWMPIEPWEYEVCSRSLSTQLNYDDGSGIESIFSGIYADTITLMAYRRAPEHNVESDPQFLYEIAWYFQPKDEDKNYNVKLIDSKTGKTKVIVAEKTGAGTRSGDAGYYAFYSIDFYDKAYLTDESTDTNHYFIIVNTTDANR